MGTKKTQNNMNKIYLSSYMKQLPIGEYTVSYKRLVAIVDNELPTPTDDTVKVYIDKVHEHIKALDSVEVRERGHRLTPVIQALHQKRLRAFQAFKAKVKSCKLSIAADQQESAEILDRWLKSLSISITSARHDAITAIFKDLSSKLTSSAEFGEAIIKTGAQSYVTNMISANEEYLMAREEKEDLLRNVDIDAPSNSELIKMSNNDMRTLTDVIVAHYMLDKTTYNNIAMGFMNEANRIRTIIRTAKTNRLKKKEENNEDNTNIAPTSGANLSYADDEEMKSSQNITPTALNVDKANIESTKQVTIPATEKEDSNKDTSLKGKISITPSNLANTSSAESKDGDMEKDVI